MEPQSGSEHKRPIKPSLSREERDSLREYASEAVAPGHGPNGPAWQQSVLRVLDALDAAEACDGEAETTCGECRLCLLAELEEREQELGELERKLEAAIDCGPAGASDPCGVCQACLADARQAELCEAEREVARLLPHGAELAEIVEYVRHTLIAHHELAVERAEGLYWRGSVEPALQAAANLRERTPDALADCLAVVRRVHRNLDDVGVVLDGGSDV